MIGKGYIDYTHATLPHTTPLRLELYFWNETDREVAKSIARALRNSLEFEDVTLREVPLEESEVSF